MCTASHTYSVPFEPCVHSVCETGPASLRPLSCPALGPRVIDRPRDSGSGGFAPSSPAQPRLRAAPLRSSPWALSARWLFFFCRQRKSCSLCLDNFLLSPGGRAFLDFFAGYGGGAGGILPRRACPCEYVARRPPHRRWVQETQPHTCGCAERILTAEFQKRHCKHTQTAISLRLSRLLLRGAVFPWVVWG